MKSAEQYIDELVPNREYPSYYHESQLEAAINAARIDAIKECAEKFVINEGSCGEFGEYQPPFIENQSILSLIDQVK